VQLDRALSNWKRLVSPLPRVLLSLPDRERKDR
jgi:hypothetical protein